MWKKKVYVKDNLNPFAISRTKVDLFFDCKRCFYLDLVFGIRRPHGTPLVFNNTINERLKKEFDHFRESQETHPEIAKLKRNFIPANDKRICDWKNSFKGIRHTHKATNLQLFGTLDDLWFDRESNRYLSVIFKSTSKKESLSMANIWPGYWKQLSFYTYLLAKNSIEVSNKGLILYINAKKNSDILEKELKFDFFLFEKILDFNWIEETITKIFELLQSSKIPNYSERCKFCNYFEDVKKKLNE